MMIIFLLELEHTTLCY